VIHGQKVTAIVAGRGGSKGLPGKNTADLGGRPVIAWSVAAARDARYVDTVAVSSDDAEILAAGEEAGCDVGIDRPGELASDEASIHDAVIHALDILDCRDGFVVLLQATSPLRAAADIDAGVEACASSGVASAVTLCAAGKPPQWQFRLRDDSTLAPAADGGTRMRRQDFGQLYVLNGAVYVARVDWYRENRQFVDDRTIGVIMPPERSVDIDTAYDLAVARMFIEQREEA